MNRIGRSLWYYAVAILATAFVVLIKSAAGPVLGRESPFLLFLLAPLISAWYGGLGAGLLATALSAAATAYFFGPHQGTISIGAAGWLRVGAFTAEGIVISAIASARDRAQRALLAANQRAGEILESITDAFAALDVNFRFTYVNSAAQAEMGKTSSELIGKRVWDLFPFLAGTELEVQGRRAMAERVSLHLEYYHPPLERWTEIRAYPGKDGGLSVYFRDVTRRHKAQEQVEQLAAIVKFSEDAIISNTLDGVILTWNAGAEKIYGYRADEMIGRNLSVLLPPSRRSEIADLLERVKRGEPVDHWESLRVRKDGAVIPVSVTISPMRDVEGRIWGASNVARDISERKRQETALFKWEYVFQNAGWGVVLTDPAGLLMESVNRAFEAMHGFEPGELPGRALSDLVVPEARADMSQYAARANEEAHVVYEVLHLRKDGSRFPVLTDETAFKGEGGKVLFRAFYFQDVSESKRLETKMREAQKLESLGVLAGGLAHDFNNLLTGIMGNAGMVLEWLPSDSPARPALLNVVRASERAADLTRQMLAYSGKGRFVLQRVDVSDLVREIAELIRTSIPRKVRLEMHLNDRLPPVEADPGQIQQLIMNLVINGAEAIGENPGTVVVRTGVQQVTAKSLLGYMPSEVVGGAYVFLEVRDTGIGMNEQTRARIFDPFFSTKFTGRGLGLAAVSGIVRSHCGCLKVDSAPGAGSTFRVLLPAVEGPSAAQLREILPRKELVGAETILVADDEEIVRRTAKTALEHYGYSVVLAQNGLEALQIFNGMHSRISLVLLDLTMPVMNGEETLQRLRALEPDVKVIVSSGYNEAETIRRCGGASVTGFIQKPYTPARLAEKIKSVLES